MVLNLQNYTFKSKTLKYILWFGLMLIVVQVWDFRVKSSAQEISKNYVANTARYLKWSIFSYLWYTTCNFTKKMRIIYKLSSNKERQETSQMIYAQNAVRDLVYWVYGRISDWKASESNVLRTVTHTCILLLRTT